MRNSRAGPHCGRPPQLFGQKGRGPHPGETTPTPQLRLRGRLSAPIPEQPRTGAIGGAGPRPETAVMEASTREGDVLVSALPAKARFVRLRLGEGNEGAS